MNDDDQENNGEAKTDNDDDDDESEDGVFGLTTVIDLKKHKVNERESFFKNFHWLFHTEIKKTVQCHLLQVWKDLSSKCCSL